MIDLMQTSSFEPKVSYRKLIEGTQKFHSSQTKQGHLRAGFWSNIQSFTYYW
jgi:hypothetical protein